ARVSTQPPSITLMHCLRDEFHSFCWTTYRWCLIGTVPNRSHVLVAVARAEGVPATHVAIPAANKSTTTERRRPRPSIREITVARYRTEATERCAMPPSW